MITKEKVETYCHFSGDIDAWTVRGTDRQKEIMNTDDWALIDSLIQDLYLVEKELVSDAFKKRVNEEIYAKCDGEDTIRMLHALVKS